MNLIGLVSFINSTIFKPHQILPNFRIRDIRDCDWTSFKRLGINAIIFDKDNCLTRSHEDHLIQDLSTSWKDCIKVFGFENLIIISNSSGLTSLDHALFQARSVSQHLGIPILIHDLPKPSNTLLSQIQAYYDILPQNQSNSQAKIVIPNDRVYHSLRDSKLIPPRILVIGDRISTDIILASRLRDRFRTTEVIGILTDRIWEKENLGIRWMRSIEDVASKWAERRIKIEPSPRMEALRRCMRTRSEDGDRGSKVSALRTFLRSRSEDRGSKLSRNVSEYVRFKRSELIDRLQSSASSQLWNLFDFFVRKSFRVLEFYRGSYGFGIKIPDHWNRIRNWKGPSS